MPTTTAAQKRAQARQEYDAFLASCPSRRLLDRISDKWVALILAALGGGLARPTGRRPRDALDGTAPGDRCGRSRGRVSWIRRC